MAERALPDLVSRISIDAAPLNAAASGIAGIFGGLASRAESEGQKMEGSFNRVSGVMAGVGVGIAAAAGAVTVNAIKMAEDFDTSARQLAGSAQIPVAAAQSIANSFLHSGEVTTFSAQEMVSALGPVSGQLELLSGHALTTAEAHKVMSAAAELAEATHTDLGSATKVLSGVMLAYHIPLEQADEATNSLYNTSRLVNVPIDELQTTLARLHARLGPLSPSLSDTSTLMVDLASNGITGSRAMNQVNTSMTTLLSGTPAVNAELQKLGIHIFDSSGHFVGLRSIIEQVSNSEKGMTDQQKLATDSIIFGGSSAKGMFDVIQGGVGTWDKAAGAANQAGAAHKAAGDAMGGVEGQQKIFKKNMDDLSVSIGQGLLPALNNVLKAVNPVIDRMAKWAADNPGASTAILGVAAAIGTATIAMWALNIAMQANVFVLIAEAIIVAIVLLVAGILWMHAHWNQVIKFLEDHRWVWIAIAAGMMLLLGPIGLVIVAAFFLATHWQQAMALFKEIIADVVAFFTGNWQRVHSWFAAAISAIVLFFTSNWQRVHDWFATIISAIVLTFTSNWQRVHDFTVGVFSAIWGFLVGVWNAIYGAVAGAVGAVVGFITSAFGAIWLFLRTWGAVILTLILSPFILGAAAIASILGTIWNFIHGVFSGIYNTIAGWLGAAYNFIVGHLLQAYYAFLAYWLQIQTFVGAVLGAIVNTITGWLTAAWNTIVGILTGIWNFFVSIWTTVWNFVSGVWTGIWNTISFWATTIWNGIVAVLTGIWNFFVSIWTTVWNFVTGVWTGIWNTISFWITTVYNTIVQWFTSAWNFISGIWTGIWNWLVATWTGIWNSVGQFFGAIFNTISDWTSRTWERLSEGWNYIKNGLTSLVSGIVDWISSKFHGGLNDVIGIINNFLGAVDKVLTDSPLHITVLNGVRIPPFEGGGVIGASGPAPGGTVGAALASGGLIPGFCAGGCPPGGCGHGMGGAAVRGVGAGFKTTEPTFIRALTGEGRAPEFVIPTEGRYRQNAAALWHQAGEELGLLAGQVPGFNIAHIRHESGGILGLAVGGSIPTSGAGGQCLAFVCQTSGIGCGYPAAADAAALCNSGTLKAGDVFITTEPPFGHAGYVLDANTALDSNFHLDEQIHEHPMADIYGLGPICFIDPGAPFGGASPSGGGGIGSAITSIIRSAVQALFGPFEGAIGNVPGLPGVIGKGLVKSLEDGVLSLIPVISPNGPQSAAANACQVVDWAKQGGFSGQAMYNAAAIALAESSGNPDPNSTFTSDVNGGTYGLMQFNQAEWAQWGAKYGSIGDPVAQMRAAFDYSRGGSFFDPWCTSTAAMNASGIGGCNGAGGATAGKFLAAVEACKEMGGVLPTNAYSFDQGGRWRTGTWGYNGSGHDELVLNKEQQRGLGGGDEVLEVLQRIEQKVMGHLEVNTYGTNLTPRDVAREIVQEVRAI